jgi:RNA polymerase sigma-70 factor (ECF subfamily)
MMGMAASTAFDPEEPVIEAVRKGDHYAFKELLRRQDSWVRGVVFAVLGDSQSVDDVTQQVWTAVWARITELRDTRRWRPWLYRLARNAAVDAGRNASRRRALDARLSERPETPSAASPPEMLIDNEKRQAVREAIQSLSPLYREPFVLRHLEGWSYRQIGEVMGLSVDTVETRLVRARRLLRDALGGKV